MSVLADDRPLEDAAALAEDRAGFDNGVGVEGAAVADGCVGSDVGGGVYDGVVADDLASCTVKGVTMDVDVEPQEGLNISSREGNWAVTGADGSFEFDIYTGSHEFTIWDGKDKVGSFDAQVVAGNVTDVGEVEVEGPDETNYWIWYVIMGLVIVGIIVVTLVLTRVQKPEGE